MKLDTFIFKFIPHWRGWKPLMSMFFNKKFLILGFNCFIAMVDANQVLDIIMSGSLNRVIAAIVVLLIAFLIARFLGNLAAKVLNELKTNKILKESFGVRAPVEQIFSKGVYYLVLFIGVIMALNQLGLSTIILYIILIIVLLIVVSFILLAFKDFVPNMFASFWIHQKKIIEVGDIVEIKDVSGKIVEINLTETKIETKDKEIVLFPNSLLLREKIKKIKNKN